MTQEFFKVIDNPNQVRRSILESSKAIIYNLKSYQKVLDIRSEKNEQIKNLKLQIKEINLFLDKIKDSFPKQVHEAYEEDKKKRPKKLKKKSKQIAPQKAPEPSEMMKLEQELADIEAKLKTLS